MPTTHAAATDSTIGTEPPPLEGVRVIDISRVLAGPYCATLLGLLGAEVVKVEQPSGDECRTWPPSRGDMGSSFLALNLNKRGIALNLKNPAAVEVFKTLVSSADVLVENFKTGEMERFGLSWPVLQALNPRLIYTSISAFGRQGPKANDAGYEALVQAYSGAMAITGQPGGEPVRCGASFLDMSTGTMAALGTVCALLRRGTTGRGGKVEASLLGSAMGMMANHMANYLQHGTQPQRIGTAHPQLAPYQAYPTRDGQVFIATGNQGLWEKLCRTLGRAELIDDPRFSDNLARVNNRDACIGEISNSLLKHETAPLMQRLNDARIPCSRVNDFDALLADGQVTELGVLVSGEDVDYGKFRVPGLPFSITGYQPEPPKPAPRIGEHSEQLLTELGYSSDQIREMFANGAVV
ncbi:MAG: CoA transferase [Gammaproteobacteria bacterium]|nr:CoA transferase [Gammaproteobacteria bacterium]